MQTASLPYKLSFSLQLTNSSPRQYPQGEVIYCSRLMTKSEKKRLSLGLTHPKYASVTVGHFMIAPKCTKGFLALYLQLKPGILLLIYSRMLETICVPLSSLCFL